MELDCPERVLYTVIHETAAPRKRNGTDSDTDNDDSIGYYVSNNESDDDTFERVRSHKGNRRLLST
ncbi:hypothetical protein HPB50_003655 [Hyalomma asiaticum]|uniref:Uncharacterized protein n=1 Tax=Hyalomma asiaticum TaxID=266040 RepID=A0ACB7TCG2_HYAAI|nr:hypothetical protein HPB50_003655 [Hyalomma asiaticum]